MGWEWRRKCVGLGIRPFMMKWVAFLDDCAKSATLQDALKSAVEMFDCEEGFDKIDELELDC